jgi:hypothetical protein
MIDNNEPVFPTKLPAYRAQLVRLWVETSEDRPPVWRFSIEDVVTKERHGFADLDALVCYLLSLMDEALPQPPSD